VRSVVGGSAFDKWRAPGAPTNNGQRTKTKRAPVLRRVAVVEAGRSARQVPHDGASGINRVAGPSDRSVAESPGDPRPEKETELIVAYCRVLAVRPVVLKVGRQRRAARLGFLIIAFFLQGEGNRHTEYLPARWIETYPTFSRRVVFLTRELGKFLRILSSSRIVGVARVSEPIARSSAARSTVGSLVE
jgi:hypothetical protein